MVAHGTEWPGWRYIKPFLWVYGPMVLVLAFIMWQLYSNQVQYQKNAYQSTEEHVVQLASQLITNEIKILRKDALYLSEKSLLREWLETHSPLSLKKLTDDMMSFARHRKVYDQIRFLDENGREVVRVQQQQGQYQSVPLHQLQDKSGRYYVTEVLSLYKGDVYMSPFDLNVEGGVIQVPRKPMIRVGTPVFDQAGNKRGLIVVNYNGRKLLNRIRSLKSFSKTGIWLLNDKGFWLLGPENKEWGFMYPDRQNDHFGHDFKDVWATVNKGPKKSKLLLSEGWFIYQTIEPKDYSFNGDDGRWTILSYVSQEQIEVALSKSFRNSIAAFLALAFLLAVVAGVITMFRVQRQKAEAAIRESEANFRGLFDFAPDPIVIVDEQGVITLTNQQVKEKFGYTLDELKGQSVEVLVPEKYRHQHVSDRRQYSEKPVLRAMGAGLELFAVRKDGTEFPVEISLSPVNTERGPLVLSNIRDITVRKQTEQEIGRLNDNLKRQNWELALVNNELETFSYSVSHDLRAPLRALEGFSNTLISDYGDQLDERGKDRLERISSAATRMSDLIDSLLSLSGVSRTELKKETVDVSELANKVVEELRLGDAAHHVRVSVQPGLIATADRQLLRVILDNLLGNAWKFARNTADAHIEVEGHSKDGECIFSVKDNGVGFDMKYAEKLFGAFQRFHSANQFPGTGIGLATVQRAIHKHGGRIWAESQVGEGATFYFVLPA